MRHRDAIPHAACARVSRRGYVKPRQPEEGLICLLEAVQFLEATDERMHEIDVYRARGDLLKSEAIKPLPRGAIA